MKTTTPLMILVAVAAVALVVAVLWPRAADDEDPHEPLAPAAQHDVEIHLPSNLGTMATNRTDATGRPLRVKCSTCHGGQKGPFVAREGAPSVHDGLTMKHGTVSCLACHDEQNRDKLRLADGTRLAFEQVMDLCGQCHGPQTRDYKNGSHGGMTGHWDLTQGPRSRNGCVHCHDAHAPAITQVQPAAMPRDRGLVQTLETRKEAH